MNTRDEWPMPSEVPDWRRDRPLTAEQLDQMAEQYAKEQMMTAQSEAAFQANVKEFKK